VLMRADGTVVSPEELLEKAWDENADPFTNAVRVAVMTLRRKLGQPPVLKTVPGAGYRLGLWARCLPATSGHRCAAGLLWPWRRWSPSATWPPRPP